MAEIDKAGLINQQYKNGLVYQKQMSFTEDWAEYVEFKEGRQWKPPTEKTKNMPRPMFNIISFIIKHKKASVTNEQLKVVFSPIEVVDDGDIALEASQKFTAALEANNESMQGDSIDSQVADDACTQGIGIRHYYWDNDIVGGYKIKSKGEYVSEIIDPMNVFFGNPQCKSVQKQPWIIVSYRKSVEEMKARANKNKVPVEKIDMITPDKDTSDETYKAAKYEMTDSEMCTVLCKYEFKEGKCVYTLVASNVVVEEDIDVGLYDDFGKPLYPISIFTWEERKKSIFGIGEVEGLIPNQKIVNFIPGMMALNIQDTAWSKYISKYGALKQQIKNYPGEVIHDMSEQPGDNIKPFNPPAMNGQAQAVWDAIINYTRTFSGASEVSTGDPFTKDLNAAAIIAMQNAAKIPIDEIKKRYYKYKEDCARIEVAFMKGKYVTTRSMITKDEDGNEQPMEFNGSMYKDVPLKLKIDITAGAQQSESLTVATLDKFLDNQYIDFPTALDLYPKSIVPYRETLKKKLEMQAEEQRQLAAQQGANGSFSVQEVIEILNNPELQQEILSSVQQPAEGVI